MTRSALEALQFAKLTAGLARVAADNPFYRQKFAACGFRPADFRALADLDRLPLTTKEELLADQAAHPPYGTNLTLPAASFTRLHQTTGSSGRRLRWLDSPDNWRWLTQEVWPEILDAAELRPDDRLFFPFSFGPFIGFWAAFEGAQHTGRFVLAGGGASSNARLQLILDHGITVVFCTPTYALRLIEVAAEERFDLAGAGVRAVIVAGEPGGSIPATRRRIEAGFGARVFDHSGMTEIASLSAEFADHPRKLFLLENHFVVEFLDPQTLGPAPAGELAEMVVTNLGRWDSPVIRYRTGDVVRWRDDAIPRRAAFPFRYLDGGVLARTDDMLWIKGNNVYPSAVEAVLRGLPDVAEFRLEAPPTGDDLLIVVEPVAGADRSLSERVAKAVQNRLFFRPKVELAAVGSLPRFELKAARFVRRGPD